MQPKTKHAKRSVAGFIVKLMSDDDVTEVPEKKRKKKIFETKNNGPLVCFDDEFNCWLSVFLGNKRIIALTSFCELMNLLYSKKKDITFFIRDQHFLLKKEERKDDFVRMSKDFEKKVNLHPQKELTQNRTHETEYIILASLMLFQE